MDFLKVKRNQAFIILGIVQSLKGIGIDIKIGEAEIDTIISAGAILWGGIGVVHDFWRRLIAKKNLKAKYK
jgi:hypothetical protein